MAKGIFSKIRGILLDLDGVVHVGDSPIPGAAETLRHLRSKGIPFRFLTNTTTKSPRMLHEQMGAMGLPIEEREIFTTHEVAAAYLRHRGNPPSFFLVAEDALAAYRDVPKTDTQPQVVVLGDIGDGWNYSLLNRVFNMLMRGAELVALHKGRYWLTESGLQMDIGAFVAGLEYTTGREAVVLGKPSAAFFEMALRDLGLAKKHVVMVGDDIEADVGGAQACGIRGVLVKTGKYREDAVSRSRVVPDATISSVAELRRLV